MSEFWGEVYWHYVMTFWNISLIPSSPTRPSWVTLLLVQIQAQLCLNSSKKCLYGLFTSRERFQSLGVSYYFRVTAPVDNNTCSGHMPGQPNSFPGKYQRIPSIEGKSDFGGLPYWPQCTDRRTSVCLRDLRTLLEQSSVCSHVRPELHTKRRKEM